MENQIQFGQNSLLLLDALIDGDKYGAEFISFVKAKHQNFEIKLPTLYSTLSRMEKQELISSYWRDSDTGGKRHYYSITDLGKKFFDDHKNELDQIKLENQQKKYDEIGDFQKKDKELITNNILSQNKFENKPQDDGIFLKENETYYIPKDTQEKYDENEQIENKDKETLNKNDKGIFITETIDENQIPKVKKISADKNYELKPDDNEMAEKLVKSSTLKKTSSENIENLYNTQTKAKADEKIEKSNLKVTKYQEETISSLKEHYDDMDVNFYSNSDENGKVLESFGKIASSKLFAKYFTIFMLILIESLGVWCFFYFIAGSVHYQFAYFIMPVIFAVIAFSILFSKKKYYKFERQKCKFWIYILMFIIGIALLYSLNILLGITFETIFNYETTFIYPAILLTNVLVAGIFDKKFSKQLS